METIEGSSEVVTYNIKYVFLSTGHEASMQLFFIPIN